MSEETPQDAGAATEPTASSGAKVLGWVRVVGPMIVSWPAVAVIGLLLFQSPIVRLFERFIESPGSTAEFGSIKVVLGPTVAPPQYRPPAGVPSVEEIDLSPVIGPIRDTGSEPTTVGFAVAHAMQAALLTQTGQQILLSPRSIIIAAQRFDDFPGEDYEGSSVIGALRAMIAEGAHTEAQWPYSSRAEPLGAPAANYRISGFATLGEIDDMLEALRDGKVVVASVAVTQDFDAVGADGRVIIRTPLTEFGMKAIAIVGYDSKTAEFKFANDWGSAWGKKGFGLIRDTDLTRILRNAYVLEL